MIIEDRIYGKTEITSKVLIELICSKPLQRLKGIAQFGIPDEFYHRKNYSRYEHSVGVMLLLKKLGASEEEQIAGLLHDVSHTAFSHTIDWVVGDGKTEDYQDEQHENYVAKSEIPVILQKHGYKVESIVNYKHFGLLERDLPDLCADRVDYSLREFPAGAIKVCVPSLIVTENKIVLADEKSALLFAENFLLLQMEHWGAFEGVARYRIFGDILRQALEDKTITMDDFWHDDDFVVNKLNNSANKKLQHRLKILRGKTVEHLPKSDQTVYKKFRHVDPLFISGDNLVRLSKANQPFSQALQKARAKNHLGIIVPAIEAPQ